MKQQQFIIYFIFLFFTINLYSQNTTFEYLLTSTSDEFFFDIVEGINNDIYFCGEYSLPNDSLHEYSLIVKLDKFGNFVDSVHLSYPGKSISINYLFSKSNGDFSIVGGIYDNAIHLAESGIFLSNLDQNLNLINQKVYNLPPIPYLFSLNASMNVNGEIIAGASLRTPPQIPKLYLYIFNSDFDSLKARYYPDTPKTITHFNYLENNTYWMLNILLNKYEIVDSSLNTIAVQDLPDGLHGNFGVQWDSDTSFYLLGNKLFTEPSHTLGFIHQYHPLDTIGHLYNYWRISDTIDFPAIRNGLSFQHKDSIFIGGTRNLDINDFRYANQPSWFVLLQTDSLLNIRWERFYGGDAYYAMGKVLATHDGGCLVAGVRFDYQNATEQETDIIILKFDSEGLITSSPEHPASNKMHEAIVFPNPGTDRMQVRVAVQHPQSTVELYDISGNQVARQTIEGQWGEVNTTFLPQGTYIYRITSSSGLFETGKWVKQ